MTKIIKIKIITLNPKKEKKITKKKNSIVNNEEDNKDSNSKKNNNNINNNDDNLYYNGNGKRVRYIKRNILGKKESKIYRMKPNHLLKIVKIRKGKSIMEKIIENFAPKRLPPNKSQKMEEENILNEYR